jgi:hypothetical protein
MRALGMFGSGVAVAILLAALLLGGCEGDDNSGQLVAPPINVHCQNLTPQGNADTTVRVTCPPAALQSAPQGTPGGDP